MYLPESHMQRMTHVVVVPRARRSEVLWAWTSTASEFKLKFELGPRGFPALCAPSGARQEMKWRAEICGCHVSYRLFGGKAPM